MRFKGSVGTDTTSDSRKAEVQGSLDVHRLIIRNDLDREIFCCFENELIVPGLLGPPSRAWIVVTPFAAIEADAF